MGSNEVITSVLGRCLLEPDFLAQLMKNPDKALEDYNIQNNEYQLLKEFNFKQLFKFAGFITKVKNNNTWQSFQYTRMALRSVGLEAVLFNEYFPEFTAFKAETNTDYGDRLDHFFNFTHQFLTLQNTREAAICQCILKHEQTLRKIKSHTAALDNTSEVFPCSYKEISPVAIPQLKPNVAIIQSGFNPFDLIEAVNSKKTLMQLKPESLWLLYRYANGKLHISIQEAYIGEILFLTANRNTIKTIHQIMIMDKGYPVSMDELLLFFKELRAQNLISV